MPGIIFLNSIVASIVEIAFILGSLKILNMFGLKKALIIGFLISICGSIPLIIIKDKPEATPIFLLLARVGISSNLNILYISFSVLFPPIFSHSALGFCKFIARILTILAPMAAELKNPTPMGLFTFLSLIAANVACFIYKKKIIKGSHNSSIKIDNLSNTNSTPGLKGSKEEEINR